MKFNNLYAEAIFNYGFNLEMEASEQIGKDQLLAHPTQACTIDQFERGIAYQQIAMEIEEGILSSAYGPIVANQLNLIVDIKKRNLQ